MVLCTYAPPPLLPSVKRKSNNEKEIERYKRTEIKNIMIRSLLYTLFNQWPNSSPAFINSSKTHANPPPQTKKQKNKKIATVYTYHLYILPPSFDVFSWRRTESIRPSTGAVMFMTALHSGCDSLSVYGMGFNHKYTSYYYDQTFTIYKDLKRWHDFAREIEIMKKLDKAGIIKWYKRDVPEFYL